MGCCGVYPGERAAMLKGFLCSIAIALSLMIAAAGGDEIIIEPTHATIESQEGHRLRVVFAAEDRPALIFKPEADAWDWSQTSRLVIPVENPGNEAVTLLLRLEDHESRSLTGKQGGDCAAKRRQSRDLDRRTSAAVDGHDRWTFAGSCGPRSGHFAGHGDGRWNRRLACYGGPPWDATSIGPPASRRRTAARRAGSHLL